MKKFFNFGNLKKLNLKLQNMKNKEIENWKLKFWVHFWTQITICNQFQTISQIFCSALTEYYSNINSIFWKRFWNMILQTSYEARFYTTLINNLKFWTNKLFLTLLGWWAFWN